MTSSKCLIIGLRSYFEVFRKFFIQIRAFRNIVPLRLLSCYLRITNQPGVITHKFKIFTVNVLAAIYTKLCIKINAVRGARISTINFGFQNSMSDFQGRLG